MNFGSIKRGCAVLKSGAMIIGWRAIRHFETVHVGRETNARMAEMQASASSPLSPAEYEAARTVVRDRVIQEDCVMLNLEANIVQASSHVAEAVTTFIDKW